MKFEIREDFLNTAQWTKPLEMDLSKTSLITNFNQKIVGLGSCFASNLQTHITPFGFHFWFKREICAHYTSRSILETLQMLSSRKKHDLNDLYSWDDAENEVSSRVHFKLRHYCGQNAQERILAHMEQIDAEARNEIMNADIIVITLGNTLYWNWSTEPRRSVLAFDGLDYNSFERIDQTPADVTRDLEEIYSVLSGFGRNRPPRLVVTVSPQRYLYAPEISRDMPPLMLNTLMKSILRVGVHDFVKNHKNDGIHYFPAFEMVTEELRLYESLSTYDFCHINQDLTPRYVVKRFLKSYCSDEVLSVFPLIEAWQSFSSDIKEALRMGGVPGSKAIAAPVKIFLEKLRSVLLVVECNPLLAACVDFLQKMDQHDLIVEYLSDVKAHPACQAKIAESMLLTAKRHEGKKKLVEVHQNHRNEERNFQKSL
jgi:hypothetical protein